MKIDDEKNKSQEIPTFRGEIVEGKVDISQADDAAEIKPNLLQNLTMGLFERTSRKSRAVLDRLGLLYSLTSSQSRDLARYHTLLKLLRRKEVPGIGEPSTAPAKDPKQNPSEQITTRPVHKKDDDDDKDPKGGSTPPSTPSTPSTPSSGILNGTNNSFFAPMNPILNRPIYPFMMRPAMMPHIMMRPISMTPRIHTFNTFRAGATFAYL